MTMAEAREALGQEPENRRISRKSFLGVVIEAGVGIAFLAGCRGEVQPTINPNPSATMPSVTEPSNTIIPSVIPTETVILTVTLTPTETTTPTETAIPRPEYYEGIAPSLESFTLVTEEEEKLILADIMTNPQLTEPTTRHIRIDADVRTAYATELIGCYYGENCVVRASIKLENPYGGSDLWKLIVEFHGNDGSHRYMRIYIGGGYNNGRIEYGARLRLSPLLSVQQGQHLSINIASRTDGKESDANPYTWSITNGAPAEDQKILRALEKNQTSLPDGVETITVQSVDFVPTT
jgi:hypothetical protein